MRNNVLQWVLFCGVPLLAIILFYSLTRHSKRSKWIAKALHAIDKTEGEDDQYASETIVVTNKPKAVIFSDNWDTAEVVLEEGVEVYGVIKTCQEKPNPHDLEHSIFILEYEYEVDSRLFKRELEFSINTDHIVYGYIGYLYNTPQFKYGLDDFRNSMQPGQKLKIRTLKKPPYWFWVEVNEVMAEVMRHDAVWR